MQNSQPTIDDIINYYIKGDTDMLIKHEKLFKQYFHDESFNKRCVYIGKFDCYTKYTLKKLMMMWLNDHDSYCPLLLKSFRCVIVMGYIDPNQPINGKLLLESCIEKFSSLNIQREQIDFLFECTSSEIIRDYRNTNGWSLLYLINIRQMRYNDFEYLVKKILSTDMNINSIGSHKDTEYFRYSDFPCEFSDIGISNYIKIAIEMGYDINTYIADEKSKNANLAQNILFHYQYTKDSRIIHDVVKIILILITNGLNREYTDSEGRNLMDYIYDYQWNDVLIDIYDNSKRTGKTSSRIHENNSDLQDDYTEEMKLLYEYRHTKDPFKINYVVETLENNWNGKHILKPDPITIEYLEKFDQNRKIFFKKIDGKNIYEKFCKKHGYWEKTIVAKFLDSIINSYYKTIFDRN